MFNHHRNHRRRIDAAAQAVCRPRLRRFAVESLESRLLLSGNQVTDGDLDVSIWNLDSVGGNGYVVISQGDSMTSPSTGGSSTAASSGDDVDLGGNRLSDGPLNAGQAQQPANPPISYVSDFYLTVTAPLTSNLGSTGALFGVHTTPSLPVFVPAGLDDDVIGSGDFNRDGIVDAMGYRVWRDNAHLLPSQLSVTAYTNWQANFGRPVADFFDTAPLGNNLTVHFGGVLDPQPAITIDVTKSFEPAVPSTSLIAGTDLFIRVQDDLFALTPPALQIDSSILPGDALTSLSRNIAQEGLVVTIVPATIAKIEDADIAKSGPTLIIYIDGGSSKLVLSTAPAKLDSPAARHASAEEKLDKVIDELLANDTIIVSATDGTGQAVAGASKPDTGSTADVAAAEFFAEGPADAPAQVGASADAAANQLAEGGMIAIGEIVDAATGDATAPSISQLADDGEATELVGELSRVAVMELIEGEAEPGEPESADRVMIVAAADATGPLDTVRVIAQQAGVTIALASPAGPTYFASLATAAVDAASRAIATLVGNHLATDAAGELAAADAARHAAFSELGAAEDDVEATAAFDGPHWNRWLAATPLVLAVASERALAARNKHRNVR